MANRLAWIILGVIGSGLLVALIKGGWGTNGALKWYKAKFLGQGAAGPGLSGDQMFPATGATQTAGFPSTAALAAANAMGATTGTGQPVAGAGRQFTNPNAAGGAR